VVREAYAGLREAVRRRLAGHATTAGSVQAAPAARSEAIEAVLADPAGSRDQLAEMLADVGIGPDDELVIHASRLLFQAGGESVTNIGEARGVIVGNHGFQVNKF
jgi:hypothetical protein